MLGNIIYCPIYFFKKINKLGGAEETEQQDKYYLCICGQQCIIKEVYILIVDNNNEKIKEKKLDIGVKNSELCL